VTNPVGPGGHVTGIEVRKLELDANRVEIGSEECPRVTVLGIAYDTTSRDQRDAAAEAARKLGVKLRMIEVKGEHGYGGAFGAMDDARGQPIILPAGARVFLGLGAIAQRVVRGRLPPVG